MFSIARLIRRPYSPVARKAAPRAARTILHLEPLEDRSLPAAPVSPLATASGSSVITDTRNSIHSTNIVSADGRFVVFTSSAPDLIAGQVDPFQGNDEAHGYNVFLYDRQAGTVALVSHVPGAPTTVGNGISFDPVVSRDGRYVAFLSLASDLVPGEAPPRDTQEQTQVYLYSRIDGSVRLVSHAPGQPTTPRARSIAFNVNPELDFPLTISDDGRYMAFWSVNAGLASGPADPNGGLDIFLYDRQADTVTLVSRHQALTPTPAVPPNSFNPHLSGDGRYLFYQSNVPNLIAGQVNDPPTATNLFVYDRVTGTTALVNHARGNPTRNNGAASEALVSRDGRFAAFTGSSIDLGSGHTGGVSAGTNAFLYDRAADSLSLVSHAQGQPTTPADASSGAAAISDDGRFVAFTSQASNLVPGEVRGTYPFASVLVPSNAFLYDRMTAANRLVSGANGSSTHTANGISVTNLTMSGDGRFVGYTSDAADLIPGAPDPANNPGSPSDAYLFDTTSGAIKLVSHKGANVARGGNAVTYSISLADNGSVAAFDSYASDLVPPGVQDTNGKQDVFAYDTATGTNAVLTLRDTELFRPTVYVNPAFTGPPGTDPDGAGPATAIGVDAFATIQQALNAVPWGGTVEVAPGIYKEQLTLTRAVKLHGSGSGATIVQGTGSGVGLTITAAGAAVSGMAFRTFATPLLAGGGTSYLALTDVGLTGNQFGAAVFGVRALLFGGGAADETFYVRPGVLARQGDAPIAVSGVQYVTVDGGGGNNRLVVLLDDTHTADTVWVNEVGISRERAPFLVFYRATGGSFGGGVAVVLGNGNETTVLQGQLAGAPTTVFADGGDDQFFVALTSASNYANVTLDGGPGTSGLGIFDMSGGVSLRAVATAGGQGRIEATYPGGSPSMVFYQHLAELPSDLPVVIGS